MPDFRDEISLLVFVLLNSAVFFSAWFFAFRRMTNSPTQALLDAALLGYAVQYAAVGVPGVLHCLNAWTVATVALTLSLVFVLIAWKTPVLRYAEGPGFLRAPIRLFGVPQNRRLWMFVVGLALFVGAIILMFALSQANVPILSNDALTYHFPAAQWLQQERISLFQTWFFNPANSYSPLAGSMYIAWLMAPFGSDVMARFVEVPALICVGIAMFRLCRVMGVRVTVAALIAGAGVLVRPLFIPSMMGKDDLFVAFFFIASLAALSPQQGSPVRFGLSLGLLLATKYTAWFSVPMLLLAVDSTRWSMRQWNLAAGVSLLIAGPWYLRNWMLTGNPTFPMFSLFTTGRSAAFRSFSTARGVILAGPYGLPYLPAAVLGIGWLLAIPFVRANPIARACVIGVPLGLALFFWRSPFPEARFVLPVFLLLFACCAMAIERLCRGEAMAMALAGIVLLCCLGTVFLAQAWMVIVEFAGVGLVTAMFGAAILWWAKSYRVRWGLIGFIAAAGVGFYSYVNWAAYCKTYRQTLFDPNGGYHQYAEFELWQKVNELVPPDATLAYTNIYLIYPMQGAALRRRLVYAPIRAGVKSIADLGWLGEGISGEQLVPAANRAAVESPSEDVWLGNLRSSGAKYLVIGKGGVIGVPPEAILASDNPIGFRLLFMGTAGWLYQLKPDLSARPPVAAEAAHLGLYNEVTGVLLRPSLPAFHVVE